jgi:ectoine hydroxylase-related dioxygenase (phytanoyl-CoA dioxygenase family)
MTLASQLESSGWAIAPTNLAENDLQALRDSIFIAQGPGQRCLLDQPVVQKVAIALRAELIQSGILSKTAVAIQAIAFDKTPGTNWKVTWHQDLMFPFARPVTAKAFDLPTVKEGIDYARPPQSVLKELLAVRLHLDDCAETNGPLRVSPGSHRHGILKSIELSGTVKQHGAHLCLAKNGEVLLMKPLLLHASSPATTPKHRRILHLVYHSGSSLAEPWHRAV